MRKVCRNMDCVGNMTYGVWLESVVRWITTSLSWAAILYLYKKIFFPAFWNQSLNHSNKQLWQVSKLPFAFQSARRNSELQFRKKVNKNGLVLMIRLRTLEAQRKTRASQMVSFFLRYTLSKCVTSSKHLNTSHFVFWCGLVVLGLFDSDMVDNSAVTHHVLVLMVRWWWPMCSHLLAFLRRFATDKYERYCPMWLIQCL